MRVIHLIGARCAGKSTILKQFQVPKWDVFDFYRRNGCLDGLMINWRRHEKARIRIIPDLNLFLEQAKRKASRVCIVESSGINLAINDFLSRCGLQVTEVCLDPPGPEELRARCKQLKLPHAEIVKYNNIWVGKCLMTYPGRPMVSQEIAIRRIKEMCVR